MSAVPCLRPEPLRAGAVPRLLDPMDIPGRPWLGAPAKAGRVSGVWVHPGLVCDHAGHTYEGDALDGWAVWLTDAEGNALLSLRARMAAVLADAYGSPRVPEALRAALDLPRGPRGGCALEELSDAEVVRLSCHVARLWRLAHVVGLGLTVDDGASVLGRPMGGPLIPGLVEGGHPRCWWLQLHGDQRRVGRWVEGDTPEAVVRRALAGGGAR